MGNDILTSFSFFLCICVEETCGNIWPEQGENYEINCSKCEILDAHKPGSELNSWNAFQIRDITGK